MSNEVSRPLWFCMCLLAALAFATRPTLGEKPVAPSGAVHHEVPATPDLNGRFLFYLHGRLVEVEGRRPTHPTFGRYDYPAILQTFADDGWQVISEQRDAETDPENFIARTVGHIRALLEAGVEPRQITVVGFSKGGYYAIRISSVLAERDLRYVFLAACGDWVFRPENRVAGRILAINEASDDLVASSCGPLFAQALTGSEVDEVTIDTGLGHGAFYVPRPAWIEPVSAFAGALP